jgi:hypothetical protein
MVIPLTPSGLKEGVLLSLMHNRRMYIRKYPLRLNNRNDQRLV